MKDAFYCIEIEEKDKYKTAFEYDGRFYEWNSMVMGFKNSPQIMQRLMTHILDDIRRDGVEIYLDDIVVYARTVKEHDRILSSVLERLEKNNLKINTNKVQLRSNVVKLLGVVIDGTTITANDVKKNEVLTWPLPKTMKEARQFLGLVGFFRAFIPNLANMTTNLHNSLKGTARSWKWNDKMEVEFEKINTAENALKELYLPNYKEKFVLKTDASNVGLGAVLLQREGDADKPIEWASKKLTPTEMRYAITEKEMLGVYWAVKKFDHELRGRKFVIKQTTRRLK